MVRAVGEFDSGVVRTLDSSSISWVQFETAVYFRQTRGGSLPKKASNGVWTVTTSIPTGLLQQDHSNRIILTALIWKTLHMFAQG